MRERVRAARTRQLQRFAEGVLQCELPLPPFAVTPPLLRCREAEIGISLRHLGPWIPGLSLDAGVGLQVMNRLLLWPPVIIWSAVGMAALIYRRFGATRLSLITGILVGSFGAFIVLVIFGLTIGCAATGNRL